MTDPIEVKVTLDLDRYLIDKNVRYDEDGEPVHGEARTLEDLVLDLAARQVVSTLDRDYRMELAGRVRQIRDEVIREAITPTIEAALSGPIQRTNAYGEPIGDSTTLREIIAADAAKALTLTPRTQRNGRMSYAMTPATKVLTEEVDKAVAKEVKAIVQQVKDETAQAIREAAADAIAKATA